MADEQTYDFDVIVVGSGMSGGWVAKEMAERGLKVCVIERGKDIVPLEERPRRTSETILSKIASFNRRMI